MQYDHIAKNYMCFFEELDKDVEPKTIEEATKNTRWVDAMK